MATIIPAQKQGFGHFYDQYGMAIPMKMVL